MSTKLFRIVVWGIALLCIADYGIDQVASLQGAVDQCIGSLNAAYPTCPLAQSDGYVWHPRS